MNKAVTVYYVLTDIQVMFQKQAVFTERQDLLMEMASYVGYSLANIQTFTYTTDEWWQDCKKEHFATLNHYQSVKLGRYLQALLGIDNITGKPLSDYYSNYVWSLRNENNNEKETS